MIVERTVRTAANAPRCGGGRTAAIPATGVQRFRVRLPPLAPDETAEYWPVVTRSGLVVQTPAARSTRGIRGSATPIAPSTGQAPQIAVPRYQWASEFLGAFTVQLIKPPESFGPGPDGILATSRTTSNPVSICGPEDKRQGPGRATGCSSSPRWRGCCGITVITYETDDGALLLSGAHLRHFRPRADADAYERALRGQFDPVPPLVLAPCRFINTSHPNWLWLNRLQCLAVGRAKSMADLIVRLDIYAIRTGQPRCPRQACRAWTRRGRLSEDITLTASRTAATPA